MANKIAVANGNFSAAATWATVDSSFLVISSSSSTNLTTSNQNSAAFTPGAITVDGVALKLSIAASTAMPTQTMTVTLRNSTDAVDVVSITYNMAEIPAIGKAQWVFFKFDTTYTLVAAKQHIIQLKVSSTTTQPTVSVITNGTAANWLHMLRIPGTTAAPAAGDDFFILGELSGPNTWTNRTVTMDINDSVTDYGNGGNQDTNLPAMTIGKNGTLAWSAAAATTTYFKISGAINIHPGGTFTMGTVATPIPRDSNATLMLDTNTGKAYTITVYGGLQYDGSGAKGTFTAQGLSRTVGKNVSQCKLSADHSAGATTLNVDSDTGWLNGDTVAINGSEALTQCEYKALTGNMGASSGSITALTYAHKGTEPRVCRAILLTRNVNIWSTGANNNGGGIDMYGGEIDVDWVLFKNHGSIRWLSETTSANVGSQSFNHCAFWNVLLGNHNGWNAGSTTMDNWSITNCSIYTEVGVGIYMIQQITGTNWTVNNIVYMSNYSAIQSVSFYRVSTVNPIENIFIHGTGSGLNINEASSGRVTWAHPAINNVETWYCANGFELTMSGNNRNDTQDDPAWVWTNIKSILSTNYAWYFNGDAYGVRVVNGYFANADNSLFYTTTGCNMIDMEFRNSKFGNFSGPSRTAGYLWNNAGVAHPVMRLRYYGCEIGAGTMNAFDTGLWYASYASAGAVQWDITIRGHFLDAGTKFPKHASQSYNKDTWLRASGLGDDNHYAYNPIRGTVAYEGTTYRTSAPSIKMTPLSATFKLQSGDKHVPLTDGAAAKTVGVYIRKDSSYNGNAPRLMLRCNPAIGVSDDTVLATSSLVLADTWYSVSAALPVADDDGIAEVYVDCDGTAGNIYVDDWSVS